MPRQSRSSWLFALVLSGAGLLASATASQAAIPCELKFQGFSADGRRYVVAKDCSEGGGDFEVFIRQVSGQGEVRVYEGSPIGFAQVSALPKVRALRLIRPASNPGWKLRLQGRRDRYTFLLEKGRKRIKLGMRRLEGVTKATVHGLWWDSSRTILVADIGVEVGASYNFEHQSHAFRVKGAAPSGAGGGSGTLVIETIPTCRRLVRTFRCMVRRTPPARRPHMRATADKAIGDMEAALRRAPQARRVFAKSCREQVDKLHRDFRRNAIYGPCMR